MLARTRGGLATECPSAGRPLRSIEILRIRPATFRRATQGDGVAGAETLSAGQRQHPALDVQRQEVVEDRGFGGLLRQTVRLVDSPVQRALNVHQPVRRIAVEVRHRAFLQGLLGIFINSHHASLHVVQLRPRPSDAARDGAMEAGVTNHVWTVEEIVELLG